jgi:hypothetical protein
MFCFWSCSHGMVCFIFGAVLMVWYVLILELFSWYGMLCGWSCSHGMVCFVFGAVLMVWYVLFLELFSWYGMFYFWSCSHGIVCFVFGAVLMVWNVLFSILLLVVHISSTILYCLYKVYQVYLFSTEYLPQSKESTIGV